MVCLLIGARQIRGNMTAPDVKAMGVVAATSNWDTHMLSTADPTRSKLQWAWSVIYIVRKANSMGMMPMPTTDSLHWYPLYFMVSAVLARCLHQLRPMKLYWLERSLWKSPSPAFLLRTASNTSNAKIPSKCQAPTLRLRSMLRVAKWLHCRVRLWPVIYG